MPRALEGGELKALLAQLVKAVGGVEAAAIHLGISHQRVSQFQSPNCPDQMSFLCISKLESIAESPIVTGAAARAVEGEQSSPISAAVVEAVGSSASTLRLVAGMDADGRRDLGEIKDVQRAAQENLRNAEALADAAAGLQPGRCA